MASWKEIKKLAADLHRVQLGESAKKLSERNCIEVIAGLIEKCLIDVVFSLDGKEYITRDYLRTQIINETLVNEGRIDLVDLQKNLNVEYQNIENESKHIVDTRSDYLLCLGQLITRDYFDKVFREINEKLQESGRLTLSDITKCYDLPTDLLVTEITEQLGHKIKATVDSIDSSVLYTNAYVQLQRVVLRGALLAVTKPIQVCKIVHELGIEPGLFFASLECLIGTGEVRGSLSGGKLLERAVFVPDVYVESVERFIKNFYYQNGYVELVDVKKLASTDSLSWLQKLLHVEQNALHCLKSIVVGREIFEQIEISVEEHVKKHSWVDVSACLPFSFSEVDLQYLVDLLQKKHYKDWNFCGECFFYTDSLVERCVKLFEPVISEKASEESPNVTKLSRVNATHGSSPSAPREHQVGPDGKKNKNLPEKSKHKKRNAEAVNKRELEEEMTSSRDSIQFMSHEHLVQYLNDQCEGDLHPSDILDDVCLKIAGMLNAKYKEQLESVYLNTQSSNLKKSHGDFNEKFRLLYQNICLFDAGTEIFGDNISGQLKVHLLRTLCNDLVNLAVSFYGHVPNPSQITPKVRDSTIDSFQSPAKAAFQTLVISLNSKTLNAFYDAVDEVLSPSMCSISVKRPDKKCRTELIDRYQKELCGQLADCQDISVGLLLSCLILVKTCYPNVMVHASGKFVPQLVIALQEKAPKFHTLLFECQKLVVQLMKTKDSSLNEEAKTKLSELKSEVLKLCAAGDNMIKM